jgi:hypothetical protein
MFSSNVRVDLRVLLIASIDVKDGRSSLQCFSDDDIQCWYFEKKVVLLK